MIKGSVEDSKAQKATEVMMKPSDKTSKSVMPLHKVVDGPARDKITFLYAPW